jgi:TIR domain-containing protein
MRPTELFLSYSTLDTAFADSVRDVLHHHAIPVWSQINIIGGMQWYDEIGAALRRCDWFAVILSPHAVNSMWVRRELMFALQQLRFDGKILPLLYQSCDLDPYFWTLPSVQMIDFTGDFHMACRALLRTWGLGYKQP